ncbi:hypothetical protein ALNOE001_15570 [Candidatus Methanobinarius endosymbioticus]|uniref:Uncharacterized protein n=1 Tax=Candidatus Methanobinarius endosymbioticus TaxID=2006182 RepID=A0A366MAZ4_9EURY|nr:hypothetical protein ALNOE001_15570 [Candidatus Methanobinarius endosymbioticus]
MISNSIGLLAVNNVIYIDSINGLDINSELTPELAKKQSLLD